MEHIATPEKMGSSACSVVGSARFDQALISQSRNDFPLQFDLRGVQTPFSMAARRDKTEI